MDEFQFIESLDALLANEAIYETTTDDVELVNTTISPVHGQGILPEPTGPGEIVNPTSTSWLGDDNNMSSSYPFTMPLHSNAALTTVNTTPSVGSAPFPQYTTAYIERQPGTGADSTPKTPGPILPLATSARDVSSATLRTKVITAPNATAVAPSGMASVCSANSRLSSNASSSKRSREWTSMAVSDSEDEGSKRRHDRNLREQRRSQKITHQIDELREVLAAASVRFKPDKFSTLVSVVDYVKQLQERSTMLDMEHKKLLDTITKTNEMVNEPYLASPGASGSSTTGSTRSSNNGGIGIDTAKPDSALSGGVRGNDNASGVAGGGSGDIYNDDELVFVRNVDYKCIFDRCGIALAVASIDGRLMDCNHEFVKLTGYRREELLPNEQYQKQQRQQGSAIIADDVGSSFLSGPIFPDVPTSTSSNSMVNKESDAHNGRKTSSASHNNNAAIRNFSLFNLLSRNNMEEVFMSLSDMLKKPPKDDRGKGSVSKADYWSGNVRLSRNTHVDIRINVSLVRSPQGRAKFFDCSLTPLTPPLM